MDGGSAPLAPKRACAAWAASASDGCSVTGVGASEPSGAEVQPASQREVVIRDLALSPRPMPEIQDAAGGHGEESTTATANDGGALGVQGAPAGHESVGAGPCLADDVPANR